MNEPTLHASPCARDVLRLRCAYAGGLRLGLQSEPLRSLVDFHLAFRTKETGLMALRELGLDRIHREF
jgi:hypothetical protein